MSSTSLSPVTESQSQSTRSTGYNIQSAEDLTTAATEKAREAAILAWANLQYSRCRTQRQPVERQWYVNLAFYFGKQNIQVVTSQATANGFQLTIPNAPPWRVRLVINRMRPTVRKQVSLLCQQKPRFYSVPADTSDEALAAGRVAEALLDSFYRENGVKTQIRAMAWWGTICGTSYMKTYWDKYKKDKYQEEGTVVSEAIDPFHVYVPDLMQTEIELQPYVIHATTMNPEMVKQRYNYDVAANVVAANSILEDQFLNLVGVQTMRKDQVLNLEFWIKPNMFKLFPKGAILTVCGDKVVQLKEGVPYDHGQFPFARYIDVESGKFYGESVLTDLLPLQREFNRTRSQVVESKNLMAKPKLLAARGSVNPHQITSEPGQVILYTPGFTEPKPLQLTPMPAYVLEEVDRLQRDMEDIAGQHDISRLISSRTSATALSYVQNADSLMSASATNSIEDVMEKTGRQLLSLVKQFWTTARTVKVVGPDEAFETVQWRGKDLKDNTEVYVESGSAMPQDKSAKQAFLMDLFKMGAIQPQQMLEMLDIGGIEKVYEDYLVDKRQAQRENIQMVKFATSQPEEPSFSDQLLGKINPIDPQAILQQLLGGNNDNAVPGGNGAPTSNPAISLGGGSIPNAPTTP